MASYLIYKLLKSLFSRQIFEEASTFFCKGQKINILDFAGQIVSVTTIQCVEKREPSCTVGGNVNWYSHYGEQYGGSLKN